MADDAILDMLTDIRNTLASIEVAVFTIRDAVNQTKGDNT